MKEADRFFNKHLSACGICIKSCTANCQCSFKTVEQEITNKGLSQKRSWGYFFSHYMAVTLMSAPLFKLTSVHPNSTVIT